ncbi:M6 family metalloprotease domain-containing protein [Vibrio sp. S9_S30]|uniref:immune inhibitor A domain-containing protein n=1 Tax=Vibrio sp. S9_S30 TaxID=2720226 RepID=UPI001681AAC1|nr:immune inhibitor A domain-containing protein [Vibrio sp. S9_S30]MBD1557669.1 M6 family metalloprotease domain-containing protein [Vibrio sp. S9_S30]
MVTFKNTMLLVSSLAVVSGISYANTPVDMGVVNEERIADMLIRSGKLSKDATQIGKEEAVNNFLNTKLNSHKNGDAQFGKKALEQRNKIFKSLANKKGKKLKAISFSPGSVTIKRTDKVIALMIDFPDLPWDNNRVTDKHTDMLYDSYPVSHYSNLLFSPSGYEGPNGENIISMRQYYEQESGGTYSVTGEGFGWYRASKDAAYYGGSNDSHARELVREALNQLANDPSVNLADYDIEDRYDYDGDGDYREPDGLIDHLMIFHSSVGEEAGGGVLGEDAIWSHRWDLGSVYLLPGTSSTLPDRFNGQYAAFDYTIQPLDAAVGVAAHEYAHDLGLPDEYDTQRSGKGEPVAYWSIMSSGSWAGELGGIRPTAFSSYAKEFLQESIGGRWLNTTQFSLDDVAEKPRYLTLFETTDNLRPNMVKIELPTKISDGVKPFNGEYAFYSQKGDNLNNSMSRNLTVPSGGSVTLSFKAWYQIEVDYDYARVLVNGTQIAGNITTTQDPYNTGLVPAITGDSKGWVDASFDVSAWAGSEITLTFDYVTDGGLAMEGLYVDNITFEVDGETRGIDDAEGTSTFAFSGFSKNNGFHLADHYYLLQWRSHDGVDKGLKNIRKIEQLISYDPGLLVWYVDNSFTDNWVGLHPGEGWLGVVDADQTPFIWSDGEVARSRYQVRDAAFSLENNSPLVLVDAKGNVLQDTNLMPNRVFDDKEDYSSPDAPHAGRKVMEYGLSVRLIHQSPDNSYGVVQVSYDKPNNAPIADFVLQVEGMNVTSSNVSRDPDGQIVSYLWDFGNGQTSTEANPSWRYSKAGEYTVVLTVTDDQGATASHSETIEIVAAANEPPVAQGGYFPLFGHYALLYSTSYDPDGHIVKTRWKLGKKHIQFGIVIFTRLPANIDAVKLTVTDNEGARDSTQIRLD